MMICAIGHFDRSTHWGKTMQTKVTMMIESVPISPDIVYLRDNGLFYSKRSEKYHVRVEYVCNSPCAWVEIEASEETFTPGELVVAECTFKT